MADFSKLSTTEPKRASAGAIAGAIGVTFVCALIASVVTGFAIDSDYYYRHTAPAWAIIVGLLWLIVHPFISRAVYQISQVVFDGINQVFDLQGDKKWGILTRDGALLFGAFWPVTILFTLFSSIGLLFGWVYRSAWRD